MIEPFEWMVMLVDWLESNTMEYIGEDIRIKKELLKKWKKKINKWVRLKLTQT